MDDLAARDDGHVGAEPLDDLQHMRREKDRSAAFDAAFEHVAQRARGHGVHAFEWFVEEEQVGIRNQRGGEGEFLLHAVRVFQREFFLIVQEIHDGEQFGGALADDGEIHPIHAADEGEVFAAREIVPERKVLRHDTDAAFDGEGPRGIADIFAEDLDAPAARGEQAGEHLDGGGFARAVRPEEAVEAARLDAEIKLVHRAEIPEVARELEGFNGDTHVRRSVGAGRGAGNGKRGALPVEVLRLSGAKPAHFWLASPLLSQRYECCPVKNRAAAVAPGRSRRECSPHPPPPGSRRL